MCLQLAAVQAFQAQEPKLKLLSHDNTYIISLKLVGAQEMVALNDISEIFQLTVHEDPVTKALTVNYLDRSIVLTAGQSLVSVNGNLVSLPSHAIRNDSDWLVPVEFLNRAVSRIHDLDIELRKTSRLVIIGDLHVPRVAVNLSTIGDEARLAFEVTPTTPHTVSEEEGRLVVKFEAHELDTDLPFSSSSDLIESFQIADQSNAIAIGLTSRYGSFRSSGFRTRGTASQFVLEILPTGADTLTTTGPIPSTEIPRANVPLLKNLAQPYRVRTIVIDPGHGGQDHGTVGSSELDEKTITLSVANRLKRTLESQLGVRVLLTRTGDQTVRLDERSAFANNSKADLLLSLHVNSSVRPSVTGVEVFYASLKQYGPETDAANVVESQILPVFGGGMRAIELTRWETAQARHLEKSERLGRILENQLRSQVEMSVRPVQQAPFRILVGANMPAALIEMGFISNSLEEQRLASSTYQNTIVRALMRSVVQFRREIERESRTASRDLIAAVSSKLNHTRQQ